MFFYKTNEALTKTLDNGIVLELMAHDEHMFTLKTTAPAGAGNNGHRHESVQVYIITAGKWEIAVGDEVQILGVGDSVIVPPNVWHRQKSLEDGSVNIQVFNDGRTDVIRQYFG